MVSRGRGRRGRPRGASQAPLVFDQQAFTDVVGIVVVAIAQASAADSQGGPSNLQRFRAHHPLIFTGGGCHARRRERLDWDSLPTLAGVGVSKSYN